MTHDILIIQTPPIPSCFSNYIEYCASSVPDRYQTFSYIDAHMNGEDGKPPRKVTFAASPQAVIAAQKHLESVTGKPFAEFVVSMNTAQKEWIIADALFNLLACQ